MPQRKRNPKPERVSGQHSVRVSVKVGEEDGEDVLEERDIEMFQTDPAYVRVSAGTTKNLGNYESLRVDVSISHPCYVEAVEETYEMVADKVSQMLADEIENYTQEQ